MNAKKYNSCLTQEKAKILSTKGSFLHEQKVHEKYVIVVYQLFDFYVEIYYSLYNSQIQNITAYPNLRDKSQLVN